MLSIVLTRLFPKFGIVGPIKQTELHRATACRQDD
jgi:hypothetical protein